jgi:flagellar biosynthesis chaperone FliJ
MTKKSNIGKNLKKLQEKSEWFESNKEIDIEEGITKAREGADIVKSLKKSLAEAKNQLEEIKKIVEGD